MPPVAVRFALLLAVAGAAAPAAAGEPYDPPALTPGRTATPPPALLAAAAALRSAAEARDAAAAARHFAPVLALVGGSIDIAYPRNRKDETVGTGPAVIARLAFDTGGDGDIPPNLSGADLGAFLERLEFDFITASLDGPIWGTDPLVAGALCTYAQPGYDPAAVARAAEALRADGTAFRSFAAPVRLRAAPSAGAEVVDRLEAGRLHAVDYGPDFVDGWTPYHLPAGGTGWLRSAEAVGETPLAQGLCFAEQAGVWRVVAQTAIGL